MADDVLEHRADVRRADVGRLRSRERLGPPAFELGTAAHRVLELGAVRLDAERRAGCGADRPAHQHVVREHEVGGQELAERRSVRIDVRGLLGGSEVLQELRLEPYVAVHHERRQQTAGQLDVDDLCALQVVLLGRALLADDDNVVPGAGPLAGERARVDVRPRAAEQVPVPEEDPHTRMVSDTSGVRPLGEVKVQRVQQLDRGV